MNDNHNTESLLNDKNMMKFLDLLDENGMGNQKKEVVFLAKYIDQIDEHFNVMLKELQEVKQELNAIQDKSLQSTTSKTIDKVMAKVEAAKSHLQKMKLHIKESVKTAVVNFKTQGKTALVKTLHTLNVKGMLTQISSGLKHIQQTVEHGDKKLSDLANELHAINTHIKNVNRVIIGKSPKEITPRNPDKGAISKVQRVLLRCGYSTFKLQTYTDKLVDKLPHLTDMNVSVKDELKQIKNRQATVQQKNKQHIEKQPGQR